MQLCFGFWRQHSYILFDLVKVSFQRLSRHSRRAERKIQHMFAIIQISRGHRKTNLLDRDQYPLYLDMPSGNKVCLPYLAALVRLADEIDVTASRNSSAIYDLSKITGEIDIIEFMKHEAVKGLEIEKDQFTMLVQTDDEEIYERLCLVASKMQKTLLSCKEAVKETPYSITQERVVVKRI